MFVTDGYGQRSASFSCFGSKPGRSRYVSQGTSDDCRPTSSASGDDSQPGPFTVYQPHAEADVCAGCGRFGWL